MVDKFYNLIQVFEERYGTLGLLAILKMDEVIDKWSLIVSPGDTTRISTEQERDSAFDFVYQWIESNLTKEEAESIARIGLLTDASHIVRELKQLKSESEGMLILNDRRINGNHVHEAFVLK